jgi:hypothetical protein
VGVDCLPAFLFAMMLAVYTKPCHRTNQSDGGEEKDLIGLVSILLDNFNPATYLNVLDKPECIG